MFDGVHVALVTPFDVEGKVDYNALAELVHYHIEEGTDGIVPCGTTGESVTLSADEHRRVIETAVQAADGQLQVIAGTGSNNTAHVIESTAHAKEAGADGVLVVTPYYNKPTQEGLYRHFKAVADAVDLPMVLYNVPSRTGVNMLPATVRRLDELNSIVGIKEASGDLPQVSEIQRTTELAVLSGDDALTLPILAIGGRGVISVSGNLVPSTIGEMITAWTEGDHARALEIHNRLEPLNQAMFVEANPTPVKAALKILGRGNGVVRLPLCEPSEASLEVIAAALTEFGMTA